MNIVSHHSEIRQVGHLKLSLPHPLVGSEPSGQCSYVYHTCKAAFEQHSQDSPFVQMIAVMRITLGFSFIIDTETFVDKHTEDPMKGSCLLHHPQFSF